MPSRCDLEIDVRDIDRARRDAVLARIDAACSDVAARRGVSVATQVVNADPPARCDAAVVDALSASCRDAGFAFEPMISRAYHDALFMARIAPTAMLFIPCRAASATGPTNTPLPTTSRAAYVCWPSRWRAWRDDGGG